MLDNRRFWGYIIGRKGYFTGKGKEMATITKENVYEIARRYAHKVASSSYLYEDAVQDFATGVLTALDSPEFDPTRNGATTYLWKAGYNAITNGRRAALPTGTTWRKGSNGREYISSVSLNQAVEGFESEYSTFENAIADAKAEDPSCDVLRKEAVEVLNTLPIHLGETLRRKINGDNYENIAKDFQVSTESARLWYHRACDEMKRRLSA